MRWLGSILIPSGRTCRAQARRVQHVPMRPIYTPGSPISASRSTPGWPAYHRRPMLDPRLERIGVGYARLPDGMLTAVSLGNVSRGQYRYIQVERRGNRFLHQQLRACLG